MANPDRSIVFELGLNADDLKRGAAQVVERFATLRKDITQNLANIEGFSALKKQLADTQAGWKGAEADVKALSTAISSMVSAGGHPTAAMASDFMAARVAAALDVNKDLFATARLLKVDGLLTEVMATIVKGLPTLFASSFSAAIATPGATAGDSSLSL